MSEQYTLERPRQRGARGLTGAILLIGIGAAILLSNLGITNFDWVTLWRFWPIALILVGLDILLGRSLPGSLTAAALGLLLVAGVLYFASTASPQRPFLGNTVTREVTYDLGDAESLDAELVIGAASARIDAGAPGGEAVAGTYRTRERLVMEESYEVQDGRGAFSFVQKENSGFAWPGAGFLGDLDLSLTDEVPVDLRITTGAGNVVLDLTGASLSSLDMTTGAGNVDLSLPDAGNYAATISGGVGNFEIAVPPGMAARIEIDGMTARELPDRFTKIQDGVWQTAGYDTAADRATIHISAGLGNVTIR
jgi:hypothetical protein